MYPFLFIDCLYGPGPTWSTKPIQFFSQVTVLTQRCPISTLLPRPLHSCPSQAELTSSSGTNVQPDAVFNKVIHNTRVAIPYITASLSFASETVHLQLEETSKDTQDATSYYLVNIPTPNTNMLDNSDKTIN